MRTVVDNARGFEVARARSVHADTMDKSLRINEDLCEAVREVAAARGHATFLTHASSGESITFEALGQWTTHLWHQLGAAGVKAGDRVALVAVNHWIFFPLLGACAARGCILTPVNPELHPDELKFILTDAAPRVVVVAPGAPLPKLADGITVLPIDEVTHAAPDVSLSEPAATEDPTSPVLMVYTSGTTGSARAVMLSQTNLLSMAQLLVDFYEVDEHDRIYGVLPLHHMNGIMLTGLVPLVAGAHVTLGDVFGFKNAKFYWDQVAQLGVTVVSLVPSIMAMLLRLFPDGARADVASVRFGFCGTAPLATELWRAFERAFGFPIYQGYGLTETTTWATATPPGVDHTYETVGVPLGCEVRIDTPNARGAETEAAEGEVLIRGPMVMPGYYGKRQLTKEQFNGDFLRTGDLGYFDAQGELRITGRKKEIIIKNGININPLAIDEMLIQHPEVHGCKTIGCTHEISGEIIESVIVPRDPESAPSLHELKRFVKDRMSAYYCPDRVTVMGYLPKGRTGKVMIKELRQILSGEMAEQILKKLTMWKYRRARPSDPEATKGLIQRSLLKGQPFRMLTYWGCGARNDIAEIDRTTLDRLAEFVRDATYLDVAPAAVTVMLNDIHSTLNGLPPDHYRKYYTAIARYAEDLGMSTVWQSAMWKECGLDLDEMTRVAKSSAFDNEWSGVAIREKLIDQAGRHCRNDDAEMGARVYFMACLRESPAVAATYPDHVFLTYNGPAFDACLPSLPKLYLYSYKKGRTEKPWFL